MSTLVRSALDDVRDLFREEIALARAELSQEVSKASTAGIGFGIVGVLMAIVGGIFYASGRRAVASMRGMPRTIETVKENFR